MLPAQGIERRRSHLSWRRRAKLTAEKGEISNSPHPEEDKPKGRSIKLHRATRKQEKQETRKKRHWVTAFTESSRGSNGGEAGTSEGNSNKPWGDWLELRGEERKPKEEGWVLKKPRERRATAQEPRVLWPAREQRGRREQVNDDLRGR